MRKFYVGAAALAFIATSVPSWAQQSSVKPGPLWNVNRIDVEDGQYENYMDYLTKVWVPNQEFAKSQGWIKDYKIFSNVHARSGEPDLYLVTITESIVSAAEGDKRFDAFQAWKKKTIQQMQSESGNRAEYREVMSDSLLQELSVRK